MKANEQGLTVEERIMFAVLGIILVIAIGVLTINYFSTHGRDLKDNNTTETKMGEQEDSNDDRKTNTSKDSLIEESEDNSTTTEKGLPKVVKTSINFNASSSTNKKSSSKKTANTDERIVEGIGSTDEGIVDDGAAVLDLTETLDWTFNSEIVKESYANETIKVPNTVKLSDGTYKEAEVIIKKDDDTTIEIVNNEISLPSGNYKYIYTCNNKTKELPLIIYNRLEDAKITIANVKDNSELTKDFIYTQTNSEITKDKNNYKLIVNRLNNYNVICLKVTLENNYEKLVSKDDNILLNNDIDYITLEENEFLIFMNLDSISLTKTNKILLTIDNIEYLFNFDITINNKEEKEEETEEQETKEQEGEKEEDKKGSDNQEKEEPEKDEEKPNEDNPTEVEEPVVEETNPVSEESPTSVPEIEPTPPEPLTET